jgi:hypothetical protein
MSISLDHFLFASLSDFCLFLFHAFSPSRSCWIVHRHGEDIEDSSQSQDTVKEKWAIGFGHE